MVEDGVNKEEGAVGKPEADGTKHVTSTKPEIKGLSEEDEERPWWDFCQAGSRGILRKKKRQHFHGCEGPRQYLAMLDLCVIAGLVCESNQ